MPARERFRAVNLLFSAATSADRYAAAFWPDPSRYPDTDADADADAETWARAAVQFHRPELLARWSDGCPAVRLALAALAVAFPTPRTLPALTARLGWFAEKHPTGTDTDDFVRIVLVLASGDSEGGPSIYLI